MGNWVIEKKEVEKSEFGSPNCVSSYLSENIVFSLIHISIYSFSANLFLRPKILSGAVNAIGKKEIQTFLFFWSCSSSQLWICAMTNSVELVPAVRLDTWAT